MDGNRRFVVKNYMERVEGYFKGFDKFVEVRIIKIMVEREKEFIFVLFLCSFKVLFVE